MPSAMSPRRSAVAWPVSFAATMKCAKCSRSRVSGASAWSESDASRASSRFWPARIASTLSVSRSAGLARWITSLSSVPRPARPVPSSLIRIEKRCRNGSRRMSLSRSRSTGELVFATGRRCSPSPSPSWIFASAGEPAVPGSHSTNRSPISPWSRIVQLASFLNGVKRFVVDAKREGRLLVGRHVHRGDHAHRRPGDLHVLAVHERGRVVEDRADEVVVLRLVVGRGAHDTDHEPREERDDEAEVDEAPHGPVGESEGLQPSAGTGAEPSGGGCTAPPGQ